MTVVSPIKDYVKVQWGHSSWDRRQGPRQGCGWGTTPRRMVFTHRPIITPLLECLETQREARPRALCNAIRAISHLVKECFKFRRDTEASGKQVITKPGKNFKKTVLAGFFLYCVKVSRILKSFPERALGKLG